MEHSLKRYLQNKNIDSFQKIRFLLFLHQNPTINGTVQEFCQRLYFGDNVILEKIIGELQVANLVDRLGRRYKLREEPEVKLYLDGLARLFEDPLARQALLQGLAIH